MNEKAIATPGDELGVCEEFTPNYGVYIDDMCFLRSSVVGKVIKDILNKNIKILPLKKKLLFPSPRDNVIGYVSSVRGEMALVILLYTDDFKPLSSPLAGFIHVSQTGIDSGNLTDLIAPGDLVKARIISTENPFQLSLKHPSLGVILASCSKCGGILVKMKNESRLICPKCGNQEKRKISSDYINLKKVLTA